MELTFRFRDGSAHEETAVYSQRRTFQLLTYHLVQKGPVFKRPTEMTLNASTGEVTIHYCMSSQGWRIQRESTPPGQESEAL